MEEPARRRRSPVEAYTAFHHYRAVAGGAVVAGIFLLNEYVATKGLGASRWHVLALLLAPALAQFVTVVWNPTDPRRLLGKRPFRALGIPSRLGLTLLLLLPFLRAPTPFVTLLATTLAVEALLLPVQNATLARNYSRARHGQHFGIATGVQAFVIMAVSLPAGWLLDRRPDAWPWLYAVAGLAGAYGYLHWSRLRRRRPGRPTGVIDLPSPWSALVQDRTFLAFEAAFMTYGIGFLMLQPVLPLYLVHELDVTYGQVTLARGVIFWLGMIVAGPLLGRLADRLGVLEIGAAGYVVLAAFPLLLLVTAPSIAGLNWAYAVYGLAMAAVNVCWNLGPIVIARDRDPLPYLNAHVALVGVRALIGMSAGSWIQLRFGSRPVFWCALVLELLASLAMVLTVRHARRREEVAPA